MYDKDRTIKAEKTGPLILSPDFRTVPRGRQIQVVDHCGLSLSAFGMIPFEYVDFAIFLFSGHGDRSTSRKKCARMTKIGEPESGTELENRKTQFNREASTFALLEPPRSRLYRHRSLDLFSIYMDKKSASQGLLAWNIQHSSDLRPQPVHLCSSMVIFLLQCLLQWMAQGNAVILTVCGSKSASVFVAFSGLHLLNHVARQKKERYAFLPPYRWWWPTKIGHWLKRYAFWKLKNVATSSDVLLQRPVSGSTVHGHYRKVRRSPSRKNIFSKSRMHAKMYARYTER
jgi:hypothetical protein